MLEAVIGSVAVGLGLGAWLYYRGKERRDLADAARILGFRHLGRQGVSDIPIFRTSFATKSDSVEDLIRGRLGGLDAASFTLVAFPGELSFEQTVSAFRFSRPLDEASSLLQASELQVERVEDWLFFYRKNEKIKASKLPDFLYECVNYLKAAVEDGNA